MLVKGDKLVSMRRGEAMSRRYFTRFGRDFGDLRRTKWKRGVYDASMCKPLLRACITLRMYAVFVIVDQISETTLSLDWAVIFTKQNGRYVYHRTSIPFLGATLFQPTPLSWKLMPDQNMAFRQVQQHGFQSEHHCNRIYPHQPHSHQASLPNQRF